MLKAVFVREFHNSWVVAKGGLGGVRGRNASLKHEQSRTRFFFFFFHVLLGASHRHRHAAIEVGTELC